MPVQFGHCMRQCEVALLTDILQLLCGAVPVLGARKPASIHFSPQMSSTMSVSSCSNGRWSMTKPSSFKHLSHGCQLNITNVRVCINRVGLLKREGCSLVKTRCNSGFANAKVVEVFTEAKGPVQPSVSVVPSRYMSIILSLLAEAITYLYSISNRAACATFRPRTSPALVQCSVRTIG
jgi:hypothetical protein